MKCPLRTSTEWIHAQIPLPSASAAAHAPALLAAALLRRVLVLQKVARLDALVRAGPSCRPPRMPKVPPERLQRAHLDAFAVRVAAGGLFRLEINSTAARSAAEAVRNRQKKGVVAHSLAAPPEGLATHSTNSGVAVLVECFFT